MPGMMNRLSGIFKAKMNSAMDAAETPGTRASVDMCEVKLELGPN